MHSRISSIVLTVIHAALLTLPAWHSFAVAQGSALEDSLLAPDPAVRRGVLANGLSYYVRHHGYPAGRAEFRLVVNAGSVLEDEDQRGLAHLLEHLAFDGTPQFPGNSIWKFFERVGMRMGADLNAATGFDETIYQVTVPTDSASFLSAAITLMEEWAHRMVLDPDQLPRERKVVIEEWRTSLGAGQRLSKRSLDVVLAGSRYAERAPIGLPAVVGSTPMDPVRRFYADWYRPDRMAVVVVGDIDPASIEVQLRERLGRIPAAGPARAEPSLLVPPPTGPQVVITADSEATSSSVSLEYRHPRRPSRTVGDFRARLARDLFDEMLALRLEERSLDPDHPFLAASAGESRLTRWTEAYQLSASVSDGGFVRGLRALLGEVTRVTRDGFTAGEFQRARTELLRRLEELEARRDRIPSSDLADELVGNHLVGEPTPAIDRRIALARAWVAVITEEQVRRTGLERVERMPPFVIASLPASAAAPSESELLGIVTGPAERPELYVERAADSVLLTELPVGGRVLRSERVESLGVERLELSNGVRILLKPTDFDRSEILLAGYRRGGVSVVADSTLVPAATAQPIVCGSGVSSYDPARLARLLAGKVVGMGCNIGINQEGVSGSSAPADLETLLQLVYLQFTAPRLDPQVFARYREWLDDALAHRSADPAAALDDTLTLLLANHSSRARLLDSGFVRQLDPARSLAFFRDRFGEAAGFTFVLVGQFDPDTILPLLERYLGGLPSRGGPPTGPQAAVTPPRGLTRRVIREGTEPRSTTVMVFHREGAALRAEYTAVTALTGILQRRLQDLLRQELGGVYGVEVGRDLVTLPASAYRITVRFDAEPARQEELQKAVLGAVDRLAADGPTKGELADWREERRRSLETASETNGYWLRTLVFTDQQGWPLERMLSDRDADRLAPDGVRLAARRYLKRANLIQVVLLPE